MDKTGTARQFDTGAAAAAAGCPFHARRTLPVDGTPMRPSPTLDAWREEAVATPLDFADGHRGLIGTGYDFVRSVLEDRRFSVLPGRYPVASDESASDDHALVRAEQSDAQSEPLDEAAQRSDRANLLGLDGEDHARLRRAITSRFSVKQARARQPEIAQIVARALENFRAQGSPSDVFRNYAQPIAAATHCLVLGIPDEYAARFNELFVGPSTQQQKYDFIRSVIAVRRGNPGDDVLSDLLASESVSPEEVEGLLFMLMTAGRDSVAYLISTATVALLTNPEQLALLQQDPELIGGAVEEFMRTGAMFITLFGRTALEDVEIEGVHIPRGTTVSPSAVAANRDPSRWERPGEFDLQRDAFGHVGFGHGIHGCVGQQVARVEIREAITQLIAGLEGLRLVSAEQLDPMPFAHPVATYEAGEVIVAWT